jgi:hypothetical protein
MTDGTCKLLFDILEAGRAIQDFVQRMTLADYPADLRTRSAVERSLKSWAKPLFFCARQTRGRLCSFLKLHASSFPQSPDPWLQRH